MNFIETADYYMVMPSKAVLLKDDTVNDINIMFLSNGDKDKAIQMFLNIGTHIATFNIASIYKVNKEYNLMERYLCNDFEPSVIELALYYKKDRNKLLEHYLKYSQILNEKLPKIPLYLGKYYHKNKNYKVMKICLKNINNYEASNIMGYYYMVIKKDNIKAEAYLLAAAAQNYKEAINNLVYFYKSIGNKEMTEKYIKILLEKEDNWDYCLGLVQGCINSKKYHGATCLFMNLMQYLSEAFIITKYEIIKDIISRLVIKDRYKEIMFSTLQKVPEQLQIQMYHRIVSNDLKLEYLDILWYKNNSILDDIVLKENVSAIILSCGYSYAIKYKNLLGFNEKVNSVINLNTSDSECIICYNNGPNLSMLCHETHILCKECYIKVSRCPCCRNEFIYE